MKYRCINCSHLFSVREAHCEDWRDKNRSFICPACSTYLRVSREGEGKFQDRMNGWAALAIFPAFLGAILVALLGGPKNLAAWLLVLPIPSTLVIGVYFWILALKQEIKTERVNGM